ncbi:protein-methionine-sulfoxide reductase catalytic subunit MsrP [Paenalcaligenes niemegkensis]|uniref:protein-methionine-sulfoxide reductase catalytic subunit MsrP n=1 Tax=Paenalcaligenes niemegkensis TaxID=2895469 RepID=UPI001EE8911B|nr:protein-methionine-sulfoxide reductase catalytic subunit MsrP [Paenalcaligenes niemegkensis]MCQ9616897.1 protein-methionine-sulfoxide reductase catalytic subunit MsrP [Paenalcaligenes niemegkensis]
MYLLKYKASIPDSEITDEQVWRSRRTLLGGLGAGAIALAAPWASTRAAPSPEQPLKHISPEQWGSSETRTSFSDVSSYNNFYEFGTDKADPKRHASKMPTRPWQLQIEGEVLKPRSFDLDDLLALQSLEERVYRLRCVEGWSMVIPWLGYSLSALLKQVEPTANAKYVLFETAAMPKYMPGLRSPILNWPYTEALRIDEAMHPLAMLGLGVYGAELPAQNGAPVRLIVPWKYGFKSAKSIVRIQLVEKMPASSWMLVAPHEYGFYANVNPDVPHPRWSQATERRIGAGLFAPRIETQLFNGYGTEVAALYSGMDLARFC